MLDESDDISAYEIFLALLRSLCLDGFPCGIKTIKNLPSQQSLSDHKKHKKNKKIYKVDPQKLHYLKDKFSPWYAEHEWSKEADNLRLLSLKKPHLFTEDFIHLHFTTLYIRNKKITSVDNRMLLLKNLEELSLSGNYLTTLNSTVLPDKIQVLELYGNQINDLIPLCAKSLHITHLGLGLNDLYNNCATCLHGKLWPHLLSLDLSDNHLTDLYGLIQKLSSLPKLKNLILMGNPFCLTSEYRGYIISSIHQLAFLDDVVVSISEKQAFKNFWKQDLNAQAYLILKFNNLIGTPLPHELRFPDEYPEYPTIDNKYFIRFTMTEATCLLSGSEDINVCKVIGDVLSDFYETDKKSWSQEISFKYNMKFIVKNLVALYDFIKKGIDVEIIHQRILSQVSPKVLPIEEEKKEKGKKKEKPNKKTEATKIILIADPPEFYTLAQFNIPLDVFLKGKFQVDTTWSDMPILNDPIPFADLPLVEKLKMEKPKERRKLKKKQFLMNLL